MDKKRRKIRMSGLEKVLHFFLMLFLSLIALGGIVVILYSIKQLIRETLVLLVLRENSPTKNAKKKFVN